VAWAGVKRLRSQLVTINFVLQNNYLKIYADADKEVNQHGRMKLEIRVNEREIDTYFVA
jgi:hypothetical protein